MRFFISAYTSLMKKTRGETEKTIRRIAESLERSHFYDYVSFVSDERRMFRRAFFSGLLRGLGMAVGFSVLGALMVWILNTLAARSLSYAADLIRRIAEALVSDR